MDVKDLTWRDTLTYHGQSESTCRMVVEKHEKGELDMNNLSVKTWVQHSKDCLREKFGIE